VKEEEKKININQTNTLTQRQTYALRTQNYTKKRAELARPYLCRFATHGP